MFVLPCVIRGLAKGHSRSTESHYILRRRFTNSQKQEVLDPKFCSARQVQVSKVKVTLEQAMMTPQVGIEVYLYSFFNLGARYGRVINANPWLLYRRV